MFFVNFPIHELFRFFRPLDHAESPPEAGAYHGKIISSIKNCLWQFLMEEIIFP
jgi:hypothetical protein